MPEHQGKLGPEEALGHVEVRVADAAGKHAQDALILVSDRWDVALLELERRIESAKNDRAHGPPPERIGCILAACETVTITARFAREEERGRMNVTEAAADIESVREFLDREQVHTVECMFADTWGIPRGKRLATKHFCFPDGAVKVADSGS